MVGDLDRRGGFALVHDAVIDLVGDQPHAPCVAPFGQGLQLRAAHHRAGRIGRARHDQPGDRPCLLERGDRRLEAIGRGGRQIDGLEIERRQDVAIGRIARRRERHPVAGIEAREEGERKAARRAGRDDHPLGRHLGAVGVAIVPRDALAQRRHAERRDIADAVGVERGVRRGQCRLGRGRAGLADLEMDDGVARRFLLGGGGHHVHDDERIDGAGAARNGTRHRLRQRVVAFSARPPPAGSMPLLQLTPPLLMPSGQAIALTYPPWPACALSAAATYCLSRTVPRAMRPVA